jgi:hypothetical protein
VKERVRCFQLRRAGRRVFAFLLVSHPAGHNVFGRGPLSGASAGCWVLEKRLSL